MKNSNLEDDANNGQSNNDIIDISRNHHSGSNDHTININKCANCFRQTHKDQNLRYKI